MVPYVSSSTVLGCARECLAAERHPACGDEGYLKQFYDSVSECCDDKCEGECKSLVFSIPLKTKNNSFSSCVRQFSYYNNSPEDVPSGSNPFKPGLNSNLSQAYTVASRHCCIFFGP